MNIDDLTNEFSNKLVLKSNKMENQSQAQTQNNLQMLKMYVDIIPNFDGNSITLHSFISACDFLFTTFGNSREAIMINYLIRVIQTKLVGRAQLLVGCRSELDTWQKIKDALQACFGDNRSLECLEQDLFMAKPNKGETSLDFAKRLQILRSQLAQKLNSLPLTEMPISTKTIYQKQYEQIALRTFIRNLPGPLQSITRLRSPENLESALTIITEEENFQYTQNLFKQPQSTFNNIKPHTPIPTTPHPYFTQRAHQSNQSNPQYNYPTNFQNQSPRFPPPQNQNRNQIPSQFLNQGPPTFPSQPINIQTQYVPRHYPTNRQVFGPPKDVFKPTGQKPLDKVEPMSTTSRIPSLRRPVSNFFKPTGPRNFISQELFQIDNQSNIDNPTDLPFDETDNIEQYETDNYEQFYTDDGSQNNQNFETFDNSYDKNTGNFQDPGPSQNQT